MHHSKNRRDSVHSQGKRRLLYLYYRLLNYGSSKNWTSRNLCSSRKYTDNKYVYSHWFQISNQPFINKKWSKQVKIHQTQSKQKQWNVLFVLFVLSLCSSLWNLKRKKRLFQFKQSFNTQRKKKSFTSLSKVSDSIN